MARKKTVKAEIVKTTRYDELVADCLEIIEREKIFFINDLCAYLPFARSTFYEYGLDKSDTLRNAIDTNKIKAKQSLKCKWGISDNATLNIALYRLLATQEERVALNQNAIINIGAQQNKTNALDSIISSFRE